MDELFPIVAGLVLGLLYAAKLPWLRLPWVRGALVLAAGLSATVLSGEQHASWAFVAVDVGEVAVLALVGVLAARSLSRTRHA